ncbi:hypothetical protein CIK90_06755 [Prevotella sp. P5-126]|nr:hypothetical protein CIK90_06755 [Prevotella sp. P5-126]
MNSKELSCDNYVATENMLQDYQGIVAASKIPSSTNVIKFSKGDVLLSNIRPYLKKVWYADRDGGCSADVFVFKALSACIPDFLHYVIANDRFINFAMSGTKGVKMPRGDKEQMKTYEIGLPSIEEQKKIAKLLSLLDERITTQNKIIDKLQSLIKGLNDSLYAQYGGKVLTSFAELGTSYSGLSGKSAQDFGSGKPFITYLNVYSNNVINENEFQYVVIKDDEKQNVAEYGDVLFTLSSETPEEVGIGSVYLGKEKVYLNSFCFGIHITNTEVAFPPYLSYYVSSTAFRKFIYPYAQGSTRFNLCKADFEKASIKLPTLENQKRIYSILSHIDSKIETERQMLDLYNSQKQYLLHQMFI